MKKFCDVSHYQTIDWSKISVEGVFSKCTQGTSYVDPTFLNNKKSARNRGFIFGSYHFASGGDAVKEASFFIKSVGDILNDEMLALDFEIQIANPVSWCKLFLDTVYHLTGIKPLIYLNSATEKAYDWSSVAKDYGLWLANYSVNDGEEHTYPTLRNWKATAIHQYTSAGKLVGVSGLVDLDSAIDNIKNYGKPTPIVETPTPSPQIQSENVTNTGVLTVSEPISTNPQIDVKFEPITTETTEMKQDTTQEVKTSPAVSEISTERVVDLNTTIDPNIQAMNEAEQEMTPWYEKLLNFIINYLKNYGK